MKRNEALSDTAEVKDHGGRFFPVFDSRKRKIRGLWMRNQRYYAQLRVDRGNGTTKPVRIPLEATNLELAKSELELKRTENRKGTIHLPGYRPKFSVLVEEYKSSAEFLAKKPGTRKNEMSALNRWIRHVGGLRVDWIKPSQLIDFRNNRRGEGVVSRTVNLDVGAFNNAMLYALSKGWLTDTPKLKRLDEAKPAKRPLLTLDDINLLLQNCTASVTKNADLLKSYLLFLAFSGAREKESLLTRKQDVEIQQGRLTIGASGDTKNREYRVIEMNPELIKLMQEVLRNLPPNTSYLFPSPQRGTKDVPARSLRESFRLVRKAAGLEWVGFHDFRHFFISTCVMARIDFMTIATWVGHKDGGVLIGKVYGHLADSHKKAAAAGLNFFEQLNHD